MKIKKQPSRRAAPKLGRLNLVIDPDLKAWAHEYAERNHTTITAIVTAHLSYLHSTEDKIDAEQI